MFLVDSHCHLDQLDLSAHAGKLENALQAAKNNGVDFLLCVCITLQQFPDILHIAKTYPDIRVSVGLHPNELDDTSALSHETLITLSQDEKVVAIGETGLDYYRSTGDLEWQRDRFRLHIRAAKQLKKPLIVHTREAKEDTLKILREEQADSGVMHCFTEDWSMAQAALDLGFYISFSGIVTFKNAVSIQDVAKKVPLDRMLIETDSPYLAPNPFRGRPNEPAYVRHVAEYLAQLRGIELSELAKQTTENFFKLFKDNKGH